MKKIIVPAIVSLVVSIIVWILTFDYLFGYSKLVISLLIAIAGVLITALILRALTKPQDAAPALILQLIVPVVVTLGLLFGVSMYFQTSCLHIAKPVIQCGPARVKPNEICVKKNGKVEFYTDQLPVGTRVRIHNFKRQSIYSRGPDEPLEEPDYEADSPETIHTKVKGDISGSFKYSISCGENDTQDPMIEVPR